MKNVILHIEGGIGKNIVGTAIVNAIKYKYPDREILVITAHTDVWRLNKTIKHIYNFNNTENLYRNHITEDTIMMLHEPYRSNDYIHNRKHLIETWCELYDLDPSYAIPELNFTKLEQDMVEMNIKTESRPIAIIQAFGGAEQQTHKYSWMRDIPPRIAQQLVDHVSKTHKVYQVRRHDQIELQGAETLNGSIRDIIIALKFAEKRILIDSFLQHAAFALGLASNVLWIGNEPKTLGYQLHNNIQSNPIKRGDIYQSMYHRYDILGNPIQLDQDPNELFDIENLMKQLK